MDKVGDAVQSTLRLDLAREQSGLPHARVGRKSLGDTVQTEARPKPGRRKRADTRDTTHKAIRERGVLGLPGHKIPDFMRQHGAIRNGPASHRPPWRWSSAAEILRGDTAEMRGLANSYGRVHNAARGGRQGDGVWRTRRLSTLAAQHRTAVKKVVKRLKQGKRLVLQEAGRHHPREVFTRMEMQRTKRPYGPVDRIPSVLCLQAARTALVSRLMAKECE
jgi:hypothetical protein